MPIALREDQTMPIPTGKGNPALLDPNIVHQFGQDVLRYLQTIERDYKLQIATVAIDAPREYKVSDRRACERAMDKRGINCFATPSRAEFEKIKDKAKQHKAQGTGLTHPPFTPCQSALDVGGL